MDPTNSVNDPSLFQNTNFNPFNQSENILLNNNNNNNSKSLHCNMADVFF